MSLAYPIRFEPIYRDYVWGGEKIAKTYGRKPPFERVAESWEIADRLDGMSIVANGPCQGMSLRELVHTFGPDLLGAGRFFSSFPLLIKILDARENLSVQVHPNDKNAALVQGEAKSEMWYVLEREPGAGVYAGLIEDFSEKAPLVEKLQFLKVTPEDAIYIPGGCVHAIGAGCLMLEVQQNSDTTYRMYDWKRKGADGKTRELHLEKANLVMDQTLKGIKMVSEKISDDFWSVMNSPYFTINRLEVSDNFFIAPRRDSFQILFFLSGEGKFFVEHEGEFFKAGMTYLIPACASSIKLQGKAQALLISLIK